MERLTERFSNGQAAVYGCGSNCKYNFKYCNNHLEDCPTINEIYEKLAAYEDLEEQGLLLKLPCKVGDSLYLPLDATHEIVVGTCTGFTKDISRNRGMLVRITYERNRNCWEAFSDFGKTVFLTQAEAEEALNRMKEGQMSKSILVIDTPKNCRECPCHFTDMVTFNPGEGEKFFSYLCGVDNKELGAKEMNICRPDWCQLRKIQTKKLWNKYHNDYEKGRIDGFNSCVDEILKGCDENEDD